MEHSDQLLYLFQFGSATNVLGGEQETPVWILVFVTCASAVVNVAGGEGYALVSHLALGVAVGLGLDEGVAVTLVSAWRILTEEIALNGFGDFTFQIEVTLGVVEGFLFDAGTIFVLHSLIKSVIWTGTLAADLGKVLQIFKVND